MRDPNRIPRVLRLLELYWSLHPDLRLGQLLINLTPERFGMDPFYLEDDELMLVIKQKLNDDYGPTT